MYHAHDGMVYPSSILDITLSNSSRDFFFQMAKQPSTSQLVWIPIRLPKLTLSRNISNIPSSCILHWDKIILSPPLGNIVSNLNGSMSQLTRLPGHIRDIEGSEALLPERLAMNAPREIMRLINWMMANAIDVDGLFVSSAEERLIATIRECLDTGADFPVGTKNDQSLALAFAQTLLQFLDSLSEPIIPVSLHASCAQSTNRDEAYEVLDELPSESVNVWISVTAFLHFIAQQPLEGNHKSGPSKTKSLAAVFAPVFLRDDTSSYPLISPTRKCDFLLYFIDFIT